MPDEVVLTQIVTPYSLETPEKIGGAMEWGWTVGYRSTSQCVTNPATNQMMMVIELNSETTTDQCTATMGDVLLWDGKVMTALSGDEFAARSGGA